MDEKILISISACNEVDLNTTINSAIANATHPDRLTFGIFIHNLTKEKHDFSTVFPEARLVIAQCYFPAPLGVGLPRTMASALHDREHDFHLQIDAHMMFERGWDTDIVDAYSRLSNVVSKPVISTYVPWWYEDVDGTPKTYAGDPIDPYNFVSNRDSTLALVVGDYQSNLSRNHIPVDGKNVVWSDDKWFEEHYLTSGHFVFSTKEFFMELAQDPYIVWGGEEPIFGMRAWTRGYNIFSIKTPIVWHKNKWTPNKDGNTEVSVTDWRRTAHTLNKQYNDVYNAALNNSFSRIKDIFLGDYLGYWGSPTLDLLKEFESKCNVNFSEYYEMHKEYLANNKSTHLYKAMYE